MKQEEWRFSYREPGMTLYHKAGLAGLGLALELAAKRRQEGKECEFADIRHELTGQALVIRGVPCDKEGLLRLVRLAFPLDPDGLIDFLPLRAWSTAAKIRLQTLLLRTWLQHPQARNADKQMVEREEERDVGRVAIKYLPLRGFKAIAGAADSWEKARRKGEAVEISSLLLPGAMVRHNAVKQTALVDPQHLYPLLLFSMLGCLHFEGTAFTRNDEFDDKTEAFLVIPRPGDLRTYVDGLHKYYRRVAESQVRAAWSMNGTSDAALEANVIFNADKLELRSRLGTELTVIRFGKVVWSQQKTRTGVYHTGKVDAQAAWRYARMREHLDEETIKGMFPLRELFATNLIAGQMWYKGFAQHAGQQSWQRLIKWRKGLHAMVNDEEMWTVEEQGQRQFMQYVQSAIRNRFGKVGAEAAARGTDAVAALGRERDRMRIGWSKARTKQEFISGLSDFFAAANPSASQLNGNPRDIVFKQFSRTDWRFLRDLTLLALATYQKADEPDAPAEATSQTNEGGQ